MKNSATLCYLIDTKKKMVLLGSKKYGEAKGKLNGFGGKIEKSDRSVIDAIEREFKEETRITLKNPHLTAIIRIKKPKLIAKIFVYKCLDWEGVAQESDEMTVKWYPIMDLPFEAMWENDKIWLPLVLNYTGISITLLHNQNTMLPRRITIVFDSF